MGSLLNIVNVQNTGNSADSESDDVPIAYRHPVEKVFRHIDNRRFFLVLDPEVVLVRHNARPRQGNPPGLMLRNEEFFDDGSPAPVFFEKKSICSQIEALAKPEGQVKDQHQDRNRQNHEPQFTYQAVIPDIRIKIVAPDQKTVPRIPK